jgi:predicted nuclease of predicted toxin-antitoxin system
MPGPIRFHRDEHIDPAIAAALRRAGVDVTTTIEAGLRSADDARQWEYAQREGRVIVTCDADFLSEHARRPDHAGIVFYRPDTRTIGQTIEGLLLVHGAMTANDLRGYVQFLP